MTAMSKPIQISTMRRGLLLFGICSVIAASWAYLALMIHDMSEMSGAMKGITNFSPFAPGYIGGLILMWIVMQAAMMLHGHFSRLPAARRASSSAMLPSASSGTSLSSDILSTPATVVKK